jgi:hypothetical protein
MSGMDVPEDFAARVIRAGEARRRPVKLFAPERIVRLNRLLMHAAAVLMAAVGLWSGIALGGSVAASDLPDGEAATQDADLTVAVHPFTAVAPGSVAEAYLDLVGGSDEGGTES